jgi:hypothetical protein
MSKAWDEITPEDLQHCDGKILMCKPVKHGMTRQQLRQVERETGAPYKAVGAIEADCMLCGEKMYIGPRQQEHRADDTLEACYVCCFKAGVTPDSPNLRHVGGK